jgi:hypothetical protein
MLHGEQSSPIVWHSIDAKFMTMNIGAREISLSVQDMENATLWELEKTLGEADKNAPLSGSHSRPEESPGIVAPALVRNKGSGSKTAWYSEEKGILSAGKRKIHRHHHNPGFCPVFP